MCLRWLYAILLSATFIHGYHFIIVPGMGGSILNDQKTRIWPPSNPNHFSKMELQCNKTVCHSFMNLKTLGTGNTQGIRITTPFFSKPFYNSMIDIMEINGHRVSAFPYDFRRLGNSGYRDELFAEFVDYIEKQNPPVIIIAHSLGGLLFHDFITTHVPASWVRQHIANVFWVSVPFGGCPESVYCVLTNTLFNLPSFIKSLRYFGGFYLTFPFLDEPVISRDGRLYSPVEFGNLFSRDMETCDCGH